MERTADAIFSDARTVCLFPQSMVSFFRIAFRLPKKLSAHGFILDMAGKTSLFQGWIVIGRGLLADGGDLVFIER